jgi:hypothetical protein
MNLSRIAALAAASVAALSVPASANHSWGGYHWATNGNGLTVKVNTSISSQWTSPVNGAIADWEKSTVLSLGTRNPVPADPKKCGAIAGQILVCNASYGQRQWLGIANIWLSNGHISQATTRLNDSYFNMAQYNTPAWRNFVACQEIGHDFGLDHQDENFNNANLGTCMDYTNNPSTNQHPNTHDYDMLKSIYGHSDGFTSATSATNFGIRQVGKAPAARPSSDAVGDTAAAWGRAIHTDGLGRPDVFVKDLGRGEKVLTHVLWTLETKRSDIE